MLAKISCPFKLYQFTGMSLKAAFFTDREYEDAFVEFGGIRKRIVERLHQLVPKTNGLILDFLSGHGFLGIETARLFSDARIICTGLFNDITTFRQVRLSKSLPQTIWNQLDYIECDVTTTPLKSDSCDIVTNFLGLEDLNMTRGKTGVEEALDEIDRVTKSGALVQISYVDYGEAPEQILAREIWDMIGLNAVFYDREEYIALLEKRHIFPIEEFECEIQKKMTARQAKEELLFACEQAPKIFSNFQVKSLDFQDLWTKFSNRLELHGMAFWSPIHVIILSKI